MTSKVTIKFLDQFVEGLILFFSRQNVKFYAYLHFFFDNEHIINNSAIFFMEYSLVPFSSQCILDSLKHKRQFIKR